VDSDVRFDRHVGSATWLRRLILQLLASAEEAQLDRRRPLELYNDSNDAYCQHGDRKSNGPMDDGMRERERVKVVEHSFDRVLGWRTYQPVLEYLPGQ